MCCDADKKRQLVSSLFLEKAEYPYISIDRFLSFQDTLGSCCTI